jgi:hypothetical protein
MILILQCIYIARCIYINLHMLHIGDIYQYKKLSSVPTLCYIQLCISITFCASAKIYILQRVVYYMHLIHSTNSTEYLYFPLPTLFCSILK